MKPEQKLARIKDVYRRLATNTSGPTFMAATQAIDEINGLEAMEAVVDRLEKDCEPTKAAVHVRWHVNHRRKCIIEAWSGILEFPTEKVSDHEC